MREVLLLSLVVLACSRADQGIGREKAEAVLRSEPAGAGSRDCRGPMNARTLAAGSALAATLQLTALTAYADKVWLESDSTSVKQFAVTPGYPNKESCLFKTTMLTDNDGVIATVSACSKSYLSAPSPMPTKRHSGRKNWPISKS